MKAMRATVSALLFVGAGGVLADPGKVLVEYQNPDNFADVRERQFKTAPEKNQNLAGLKSWFEKRGAQWVPDGQTLKIQFSDIDLAGDFEPWHSGQMSDVRIVKDIYPPKLKFHFQLIAADNAVLREGDKELRDLGFMMNADRSNEAMQHEKRLLEKWLREEFPKQ